MKISQRQAYGEILAELGAKYPNLVACDADLAHATMSEIFKDAYPELSKTSLWAVTETNTRAQLDRLVAELEGLE